MIRDQPSFVLRDEPTTDLPSTRRFYEEVLGLEVAREHPEGVAFRTGQSYLELYPTRRAGSAQHTLGTFEVEDINAAMSTLRERGLTFEGYDFPGLKTVNGVAVLPGGVTWLGSRTPTGTSLGSSSRPRRRGPRRFRQARRGVSTP